MDSALPRHPNLKAELEYARPPDAGRSRYCHRRRRHQSSIVYSLCQLHTVQPSLPCAHRGPAPLLPGHTAAPPTPASLALRCDGTLFVGLQVEGMYATSPGPVKISHLLFHVLLLSQMPARTSSRGFWTLGADEPEFQNHHHEAAFWTGFVWCSNYPTLANKACTWDDSTPSSEALQLMKSREGRRTWSIRLGQQISETFQHLDRIRGLGQLRPAAGPDAGPGKGCSRFLGPSHTWQVSFW